MTSYSEKIYGEDISPNVPVYMGIDQSYSGFATTILAEDGRYQTRVAKFNNSGVERLLDIQMYLSGILYRDITDFAMEGYAYNSKMANMLGELGAVVKLAVYSEFGIRPLVVPPTSLKKYVTGKGTGVQKNQMLLHVYKKWNVEFKDDNAADSYALAKLVSNSASYAYEKEIYSKLTTDEKHRA